MKHATVLEKYKLTYVDALASAIMERTENEVNLQSDYFPLFRMYAVLCLVKGEHTTAEDVHDAWVAWASQYRPYHKSSVPFDELPVEIQQLDDVYVDAIRFYASGVMEASG